MDGIMENITHEVAKEVVNQTINVAGQAINPITKFIEEHAIVLLIGAIVLLGILYLLVVIMRNFILNSVVGLILFFAIHTFIYPLNINLENLIIVAFGGVGGLAAILLIQFFKSVGILTAFVLI